MYNIYTASKLNLNYKSFRFLRYVIKACHINYSKDIGIESSPNIQKLCVYLTYILTCLCARCKKLSFLITLLGHLQYLKHQTLTNYVSS